ncbi:MAG TPA: adenylate cyclase, partial [Coprobacter fastidiosus]|nr:adenylate cyclase [Coprobacter fastidiosus]
MGKEIERKFLVHGVKYRKYSSKIYYKQGYLSVDKERTVRIRIAG